MSKISKKVKPEQMLMGEDERDAFLQRIKKKLYYGKLPSTDRLSLPMTELAAELFSESQHGHSFDRLFCHDAAKISRNACVSPCSFVLAMLYLEHLKASNREYLQQVAPSELFLVSLMIATKFLHDDGTVDEVFMDEWATSGNITVKELTKLEREFLNAIEWKVYVGRSAFWHKMVEMETVLARRMGANRRWYTYTELCTLLNLDVSHVFQTFGNIFGVLLTSYILGLVAIVGSFFIVSKIPGNYLENGPKSLALVPIQEIRPVLAENNETDIVSLSDCLDSSPLSSQKWLDAADVLKTSIFLASIKPHGQRRQLLLTEDKEIRTEDNNSTASWAWWCNPTLNWLTQISDIASECTCNFPLPSIIQYVYSYLECLLKSAVNLEAQIDKATKVRIQEQMERSWHIEWTDTIISTLLLYKIFRHSIF